MQEVKLGKREANALDRLVTNGKWYPGVDWDTKGKLSLVFEKLYNKGVIKIDRRVKLQPCYRPVKKTFSNPF